MKISVLIPCYNAEKFIQRSIDSVLSQSYSELELVIVDDGSTDSTAKIINSYQDSRIKIISLESNLGIVKALNIGLDACRGTYIARMDADDICLEDRLAKQSYYLDNNAEVVAVGSSVINFNEAGQQVEINYPTDHSSILLNLLLFERNICHPSVMFRANVIEKGIKYKEQYNLCEDYDLWFQLSRIGKLANIERPLLKYFRGGSQSSIQQKELMLQKTRILLFNIWQQYEVDDIDLLINYITLEKDIDRRKRKLASSTIRLFLLKLKHFTAEQVNEALNFKELRFCYRYKNSMIFLISLINYLMTIRQGWIKKFIFFWKIKKIEMMKYYEI